MFYTKIMISEGLELKVDLYEDEIYTICPICGKEQQVDGETLRQIDCWSSTSISCGDEKCNQEMKKMCGENND